jgi:hypothetical protein
MLVGKQLFRQNLESYLAGNLNEKTNNGKQNEDVNI